MAAEKKTRARNIAARGGSRVKSPARAQQQKKVVQGQPAMLVNLRVVLSATAVTILLLLLGFGAIGALLLVRSPEPPPARVADRFDPPPVVPVAPAQIETPSTPEIVAAPEQPQAPVSPPVAEIPPQTPAPETTGSVAPASPEPASPESVPPAQAIAPQPEPEPLAPAPSPELAAPASPETPEPPPATAELPAPAPDAIAPAEVTKNNDDDDDDEDEVTAAVPDVPAALDKRAKKRKAVKRTKRKRGPRVVRRPAQKKQAPSQNPFVRLFGG